MPNDHPAEIPRPDWNDESQKPLADFIHDHSLLRGHPWPTKLSAEERALRRPLPRAAQRYREECRELIERYNALSREQRWSFKFFEDIESFEEIFGRFITFLREVAAAHAGKNVLCVTHLEVLGALLLKLGYAPVSITNMAWVKLLSDGSLMQVEETGGIAFEG